MNRISTTQRVILAFALMALSAAIFIGAGDTTATYSPSWTMTPGTPTDPTPVWPTATASPTETPLPEETAQPTIEVDSSTDAPLITDLPATGAGTTSREVKAANHTCCPAAHYWYSACYGGAYYNYYRFATAYSPIHGHTWGSTWRQWASSC